ncbi:MAG: DinB family protein [Chloroflexi bacterium]|nr:DinB family protein [Chloroflexota bacterium]
MVVDRSYVASNEASRARLRALVSRLMPRDMERVIEPGWTVAMALAHLAAWDRRVLETVRRWLRDGFSPFTVDVHAVNAAEDAQWRATPPEEAARAVISVAEALDPILPALSDELVRAILETRPRFLDRGSHRQEHLDQIEAALRS